jgi:hypothetical protein
MSAWSIQDELLERRDLDLSEKILVAILDRLGAQEKVIWPRHQWLAEKMGCSERTVQRTLSKLKKKGMVKQHDRRWKIAQYSVTGQNVVSEEPLTRQCVALSHDNVSCDSHDNVSPHNKDIQSKDIQIKKSTPKVRTELFFSGVIALQNNIPADDTKQVLTELMARTGMDRRKLWEEVQAFTSYWTELEQNGKRQRWSTQKTFEVEKRLSTWLRKAGATYSKSLGFKPKYKAGIV